jgi:hypothetical protein
MQENEENNDANSVFPQSKSPVGGKSRTALDRHEQSGYGLPSSIPDKLGVEASYILQALLQEIKRITTVWMSAEEAAAYCKCSVSQINKWRYIGLIHGYYAKGMIHPRYRRDELDRVYHKK